MAGNGTRKWPEPLQEFAAAHSCDEPRAAMVEACRMLRTSARQTTPPIALAPMLNLLGARSVYERTNSDAILRRDSRGWKIALRTPTPDRSWRRERFSLAHEFGHILLFNTFADNPSAFKALRAPKNWKHVEALCNFAAAELLLPQQYVVDALTRYGFTGYTLRLLYDSLEVSWDAVLVRVAELLPRSSVVLWRSYSRPGRAERRALRVLRIYGSADGPWFPEGLTTRYLDPDPVSCAAVSGASFGSEIDVLLSSRRTRIDAVAIAGRQLASSARPSLFFQPPVAPASPFDEDVLMLAMESAASAEEVVHAVWSASVTRPDESHAAPTDPHDRRAAMKEAQLSLPLPS